MRAWAGTDALLVTSELSYPGWRASVDGEAVPVVTVNAAFRAVELPAGAHSVRFRYRPRTGAAGVVIGAVSVLAAITCGTVALWSGRGSASRR